MAIVALLVAPGAAVSPLAAATGGDPPPAIQVELGALQAHRSVDRLGDMPESSPIYLPFALKRWGTAGTLIDQLSGPLTAVALEGDLLILAIGARITTHDMSDPHHLRPLGSSSPVDGVFSQVLIRDRLAMTLRSSSKFSVFDLADPRRPREVGVVDVGPDWHIVGTDGPRILLANVNGNGALKVVDAAEPTYPRIIEAAPFNGTGASRKLAVGGGRAYKLIEPLPCIHRNCPPPERPELQVLELEDATRPRLVGRFVDASSYSPLRPLLVQGSYLYARQKNDMVTLDVSDPGAIRQVGRLQGAGADWLVARGDRLLGFSDRFLVLDASDPLHLSVIATSPQVAGTSSSAMIDEAGGVVMDADRSRLAWVDLTSRPSMPIVAEHPVDAFGGAWPKVKVFGAAVQAPYAFVSTGAELVVLDTADPGDPMRRRVVARAPLAGETGIGGRSIVAGRYAVYLTRVEGLDPSMTTTWLDTWRFQPPARLERTSSLEISGGEGFKHHGNNLLALARDQLYLREHIRGWDNDLVRVFDLADPWAPEEVGRWFGGDIRAIDAVDAQVAVLAVCKPPPGACVPPSCPTPTPDPLEPLCLSIVDVANPADPQRQGDPFPVLVRARRFSGLAWSGQHVFVDAQDHLLVIDVANPGKPVPVATLPLPDRLNSPWQGLIAGGSTLYRSRSNGLLAVDITDPERPRLDTQFSVLAGLDAFQIGGDQIFGFADNGVWVFAR